MPTLAYKVKMENCPYSVGETILVIIGVVTKPISMLTNVPIPIIEKCFKKLWFITRFSANPSHTQDHTAEQTEQIHGINIGSDSIVHIHMKGYCYKQNEKQEWMRALLKNSICRQ